ncbi:hypothetical protein [Streptomyces sp. B1I3]|uniref:hypothetical protein n=1 Tax=Streptomyces sp. B1I3 TaxID=3042264 RepID=UPI0027860070|nr:hypothetical protein [Streptomyces sp. B1I3]
MGVPRQVRLGGNGTLRRLRVILCSNRSSRIQGFSTFSATRDRLKIADPCISFAIPPGGTEGESRIVSTGGEAPERGDIDLAAESALLHFSNSRDAAVLRKRVTAAGITGVAGGLPSPAPVAEEERDHQARGR